MPFQDMAPRSRKSEFFKVCVYFVEAIHNKRFRSARTELELDGDGNTHTVGWPERHDSYFWPSPQHDSEANAAQLSSLIAEFRPLVSKLRENNPITRMEQVWDAQDKVSGVELAIKVFEWGTIRRIRATPEKVYKVLVNAVNGRIAYADAPMNSGWSKVAAIGSAAGAAPDIEGAIWDSRVSTGIVINLDQLLDPRVCNIDEVRSLRMIRPRGKTRLERQEALRAKGWPLGWGTRAQAWQTHFAGAKFLRTVTEILNGNPQKYGKPRGATRWSLRSS
jgi:hypothetical protein